MYRKVNYDVKFVIGTPLVGWKCDKHEELSWLEQSHRIRERFPNVMFMAAFELERFADLEKFDRVIRALGEVDGTYWTYMINDNEKKVNSENRLIRIETGRNLVREYAQRQENVEAILYVDSDIQLTVEIVEALFEVDRAIASVHVPQYNLRGPAVQGNQNLQEHWNTAGMLLVNAPACWDLPWYHNMSKQLSDDPAFQHLAERLPYGMTWVRKDIQAQHRGHLITVEQRGIPERQH